MRRKGKRRLPSRASVRLEAQTVVNGCWSVDFMSDALMLGQRFRTFNVLDDFSREVLAVEVDTNLPVARVIRVLDRIAAWRGYPTKMCMDNGPEFVSAQLAGGAEQHGIDLEFTQPGKPTQNSYVERFNRTFRGEVLNFYVFSRLSEVRTIVDVWVQELQRAKATRIIGQSHARRVCPQTCRGLQFSFALTEGALQMLPRMKGPAKIHGCECSVTR